jgi:hypothetical protein
LREKVFEGFGYGWLAAETNIGGPEQRLDKSLRTG